MMKLTHFLLACFWIVSARAADVSSVTDDETSRMAHSSVPDSKIMETALQQLDWKQFKRVIEAVPKMKADVDAYGQFGWQYVQMNYKTYRWRKNIDRLDGEQKHQLGRLIQIAKQAQ